MSPDKIKTGFHRIGTVLLVLPLLGGLIVAGVGAFYWGKPLIIPPRFEISDGKLGKAIISYGSDPKDIGKEFVKLLGTRNIPEELLKTVDGAIHGIDRERASGLEQLIIGAALMLLGGGLYAASWLVGWIIRGFVG